MWPRYSAADMGQWTVDWGVLLTIYAPFLLGLAAFALIGLAAWPRPSRWVRIPAGALGTAILLWALWHFIFRTLF